MKFKQKKTNSDHYTAHGQQLKEHCDQAWKTIKKNPGKKFFGIKPRPWILLLGTPHSGKTSLLRGISVSLASSQNALVNWWMSPDAIFIDPFSNIALPTNAVEKTQWKTLLNRIQQYRVMRKINCVLLVIDIPSLETLSKDTLNQLGLQLQSVQEISKIIPVNLVISQCDTVEGFRELFDDLNLEERQKTLGITFCQNDLRNGILPAFETAFQELKNRLQERLIYRMHHEQNIEKRRHIFNFPSQFFYHKKNIEKIITHLPFNTSIPLKGIFFTSVMNHRHYFIDSMMQSVIFMAKQPLPPTTRYAPERLLALPIAAAFVCGFTLLWHMGYNQTVQIINTVQTQLTTIPMDTPNDPPWLGKLNILSNILDTTQKEFIHYQWIGLLQTYKLNQIAQQKYQELLDSQFIPYLKSTVESQIQQGIKGDKLALFDSLKTYLSMTQKKYFDKNIIMDWFIVYWKAIYPHNVNLQTQLQNHLSLLLKSNKPLWLTDETLIQSARTALQELPLTDLAFLELQGEYPSTNIPILENEHFEGLSLKDATVPSFFSTENFKEIFNDKIPNIGKTLAKGNWVLGTTQGIQITPAQQLEVSKKLEKMYLGYYSNVWASTVTRIRLTPAQSYPEVLQQIENLLNPHSNLNQLLKLIIGHANLSKNTSNENLTAIKDYLNKNGRYTDIQNALINLKKEIEIIQKSPDPDKESFVISENRFKQNGVGDPISNVFSEATQNSDPILDWLNTIALSSWNVMLDHTKNYLNTIWKNIVLPVYQNDINHRFPVFEDSSDDTSLKNFNDFFGPNGAVSTYFIYYLQPFVNMSQNYWTWKSLNGVSLNIPQKVLNMFIRASIIQQMFFTDDHNNPSFHFILSPLVLSGNALQFTLNMGGNQIYTLDQKTQTANAFDWPGSNPNFIAIQFISTDGKTPTKTYHGSWAWFRMLKDNTLQNTADPKQFILTIQIGNQSMSFRLIAEQRVNPMVPGVLGKFRCVQDLNGK